MLRKKSMIILAVCGVILANCFSASATCSNKEYAELKDMEESDLLSTYCSNKEDYDMSVKYADIYHGVSEEDYKYHVKNRTNCYDSMEKIKTAYKAKFKKAPECPKN